MKRLDVCLVATVFAALVFQGCGDDGDSSGVPIAGGDVEESDGIILPGADVRDTPDDGPPPADTVVITDPLRLEFVAEKGDDGVTCKGNNRCSVSMSFNTTRDLEVKVLRGTELVGEVGVRWTITKNPNNSLKLNTNTSYTLPEGVDKGVASATVSQTAQQVQQYEVKVESLDDVTIPPLFFDVAVTPKGQIPLTVTYKYGGTRSFQGVTTYLFKQTEAKPWLCTDIDPKSLPTADLSSPPKGLTQSTAFTSLPGLEQEGTQAYTVVGIGKDLSGPAMVFGCDDTKADVSWVGSKTVQVQLTDLPPLWKKQYEVTTSFDLVSALPDNVEKWVNVVLGLFSDPAAQLLVLVCDIGKNTSVISDLCGYAFKDPANPCIADTCFDTVGLAIKQLMGELLVDLIQQNDTASDIFFTGQDLAKILKELELVATYEINEEPNFDGSIVEATTAAEWHTVNYRWTLGTTCDPTDKNCGKRSFSVQAFQGGTITGVWSGKVEYPDNKFMLNINEHSLNIKYGALLLYIVEKEVLPLLAGVSPDSPKVDSIEEYLKVLVGGKECLKLEFDPSANTTCCDLFAENITNGGTGFTSDIAKAACDVAIPLAEQELTKFFTDLDLDTGNGFRLATQAACQCYDLDANLTIDAWGKSELPCVWDTTIQIGSSDIDVTNEFTAIEPE